MKTAELIIFPGVRIEERPTTKKRQRSKPDPDYRYVAIRLQPAELKRLDEIAACLGICREDAVARMFRHGLLAFEPLKPNGSAA